MEHGHEADIALVGTTASIVRHNVTTAAGHDGIALVNAGENLIEHNVAMDNLAPNACGINIAAGSARNLVRHNRLENNEWGIQIIGGTTGDNVISKNVSRGNRGNGIRNVLGAPRTIIESNQVGHNGFAPSAPTGGTASGIRVASGTGIVVRANQAFGNSLVDLFDQTSTTTFEDNRCGTSSPPGLCERGRPST